MANKKDYDKLTVAQLKELAAQNDVEVRSDATKGEIIEALQEAHIEPTVEPTTTEGEGPEVETFSDPYEEFADPIADGSKPILDQVTPSNVVQVLVFDGSNALTLPPEAGPPVDHLVFVQSGRSQEFLLPEAAKRKFGQDKAGQIYYNQHGMADEFKPVDVVALGT